MSDITLKTAIDQLEEAMASGHEADPNLVLRVLSLGLSALPVLSLHLPAPSAESLDQATEDFLELQPTDFSWLLRLFSTSTLSSLIAALPITEEGTFVDRSGETLRKADRRLAIEVADRISRQQAQELYHFCTLVTRLN
jgi:hypothetical protein